MPPPSRPEGPSPDPERFASLSAGRRFRELCDAGRTGEAAELAYGRCGRLRGFLLRCYGASIGHGEDVEDLLHGAVLRAVQRGATFDAGRATLGFDPWFFKLAVNHVEETRRSQAARRDREARVAGDRETETGPRADELRAEVDDVLSQLDARHADVLRADLRAGRVAPASELARALDRSVPTVFRWRREARAAFARLWHGRSAR